MKSPSIRLLAVTPLFVSAMATSAIAQEAVMATPVAATAAEAAENLAVAASVESVTTDTVVYPLKVTVAEAGTYVFTSPADNPVKVSLDGEVIMTVPELVAADAEPFRVITSLTAGDHLLEIEGSDLTLAEIALVSMNQIGEEPVSVANVAQALTSEQAEILAAAVSNLAPSAAGSAAAQTASANGLVREPFMIGGGSADRASDASGNGGSGDMMNGGLDGQMASADQAMTQQGSTATGTTSSGTTSSTDSGTTVSGSGSSSGGSFVSSPSVPAPGTTPGSAATPPAATPAPVVPTPVTNPPVTPVTPVVPIVPIVVPANMARASALTPPTNVTLTQAVEITGGASEAGVVSSSGQTLFGQVMDPATFDTMTATVEPSGRPAVVDIGATTGQFAVRLFPEDLATGTVRVTLVASSSANAAVTSVPVAYEFTSGVQADGITQALSRMTNGPTADLYARVREIGFANYVTEQLSPATINDAAFDAMNFEQMLHTDDNNEGRIEQRLFRYNMAHSAFSEKQLQDVMGDFWSNHFFASTKDSEIRQQNVEDREFYRENAFGNFGDLLLYSDRSPLMSQFLDNDRNEVRTNGNGTFRENINENYGREILELHTVGVNGGYTEEDVIQSARIFTGWNYRQTNEGVENAPRLYEFEFRDDRHDPRDKVFSAQFLNGFTMTGRSGAAGEMEGQEFIALLASDPRTQSYVCGKIVERFVSDDMPANFVQICVNAWATSGGNAGSILQAILTAPEFVTTVELQRNKAKTPYEFAVSVIRALDLRPDADDVDGNFFDRFVQASDDAGYDPMNFQLPTGLPEAGTQWTTSASMIAKFREMTEAVERQDRSNMDLQTQITNAGLETAEEVAGYLLSIGTADRFDIAEYDNMVAVLKGEDGIFEPLNPDQADDTREAFERAAGLLIVLPNFQLQ